MKKQVYDFMAAKQADYDEILAEFPGLDLETLKRWIEEWCEAGLLCPQSHNGNEEQEGNDGATGDE